MKHYTATLKVILEAEDMEAARLAVETQMSMGPFRSTGKVLDWGYAKTGPTTRAFPAEVKLDPDQLELIRRAREDDEIPVANYRDLLLAERGEIAEREREMERLFDEL